MEMNIALLLKTARTLTGKNQQEVADAGVVSSRMVLSQYENGKISPTAAKIDELMKYYGYHFELVKNRE